MVLSDQVIERYARQIIIPGVGASGQQQLGASTVVVAGRQHDVEVVSEYLRAAGVGTVLEFPAASVTCLVLADPEPNWRSPAGWHLGPTVPVIWYRLAGTTLLAGIDPALGSALAHLAPLEDPTPDVSTMACAAALHTAAACDAANTAIAVILKWFNTESTLPSEVRLA